METKLLARIGAAVFVAGALTMTALELREEPRVARPEPATVFVPDGDPLPAQLRACAAMGEIALSLSDCRAAWAEKRRRFLGRGGVSPADAPPAGAATAASLSDANADGVADEGVR